MNWLGLAVSVLQVGAALVEMRKQEFRFAGIWLSVGLANGLLAWGK